MVRRHFPRSKSGEAGLSPFGRQRGRSDRRPVTRGDRRLTVELLETRCLLSVVANGDDTPELAAVELVSPPDLISLRYDLPALAIQPTGESLDGREVSQAIMPGADQTFLAGQPNLPVVPVEVVVPSGRTVGRVDVSLGPMVTLAGSYVIEQGTESMVIDPSADPAGSDVAVERATAGTFPESVLDVIGVQRERGVEILTVTLNPVRYTIETGTVSYYTTLTLNVSLTDGGAQSLAVGPTVRYRTDNVRPLEAEVANPSALETYVETAAAPGANTLGLCDPAGSYQYVAITGQAFANASTDYTINDLVASKQARGMSATVVTVESIYAAYTGVDQQEQIRNFITDAYNNWETDFVLLGGDTNVVPYRGLYTSGDNVPSDLYYQCLDGNFNSDGDAYWGESTDGPGGSDVDLLPEVYIGRASAETADEMANWVYKAIAYQDTAGADYRRDAMMVGEYLGFGGVSQYATASMEEIRLGSDAYGYTTAGFAADPTFTTSTLYDSETYTWSAADLMAIFNSGDHGIYNHLGHANTSYVMKLVNSNVDTLTNDDFFFAYSQGCYPGNFPADAIAEHFTTSTRYGAAAVIFNSRYGYGRGNSTDGPSQRPNREFWDALFGERLNQLGVMNADSHVDVLWGINESLIRWVVYETNLFGDPAAEVVSLDLCVMGSSPAGGEVVSAPPTDFTVTLSDPYVAASVDAGDLLVNGIPADSFTRDGYTITFHYNTSPVTAEGPQTMSIAAGAIQRESDGGDNRAWSATFRYDVLPMAVISTEPADGSTVLLPLTTLRINVNEEIDPASVGVDDLYLSQGTVIGAVRTDADTVEYTLSGIGEESTLSVSMARGALVDVYGNPSLAYSGSLVLDFGSYPFPTPLAAEAPLGSMVYDGSISGHITSAGDADSFTIELDAGQTLTALVVPGSSLAPTVTVSGPGGTTGPATATEAGKCALLETVPAEAAGTYTVTVASSAGTTGSYELQLVLNAAVEAESHDGASNNDFDSAQSLEAAFLAMESGGERAAVLGVTDPNRQTFLSWNMDEDPGWTYEDDWAWGQPTGNGGDPASGHTGVNVVGYNLDGQYANSFPVCYATTPAFSTLGKSGVQVSFWRWLGVERSNSDHATIEVSRDGATWTTFWSNGTTTLTQTDWSLQTYDISAVADNQAQVFLRFGMGPTNATTTNCGWNIDDVTLSASTASDDYYSFTLAAGQSATVALTSLGADDASLALYGSSRERLALATTSLNCNGIISDFVAPAAGTYYVRVTGTGVGYDLLLTKDLAFHTGVNTSLGAAQDISGRSAVLGYGGAGGTVTLESVYSGWWDSTGTHSSANQNYLVGLSGATYRDFFVFDMQSVMGTIGGGQLLVWNPSGGYVSSDPTEIYAVFDVSTPIAALEADGSGQTAIFDDLGGGTPLGSQTVSAADNGRIIAVTLDSEGLRYLNGLCGQEVALGGSITTLSGAADQVLFAYSGASSLNQLVLTLTPSTWYRVSVAAGDTLELTTSTPAGGSGEFVNGFDPCLELYDPNGVLLASDDNSLDGRNARIQYTALTGGEYVVHVGATANSGEYVLHVSGATGAGAAFAVAGPTEPADGSRLRDASRWTIHFNDAILLSTLGASDLTVDGVGATAVTIVDDRTALFTLPGGLADGLHNLAIAGGAIEDLQQTPLSAWSGQFTLDTTPPRVVASSLQEGATLSSGDLTVTIQFNEPMRTANLDLGDFPLVATSLNLFYSPVSFSYDAGGTVLTLVYAGLPDDSYTFALRSGDGRFEDVVGVDLDGEPTWPLPGGGSGDGQEGGNFRVGFTIHAWGANHAPAAADDVYNMNGCGTFAAAAPGVLSNDGDPDSDPLAAVLVEAPAHGTLSLGADGSFQYTPEAGFFGTDQFIYRANDGAVDSVLPATVLIRVGPPRMPADFQTTAADGSPSNLVEVEGMLFFTATDALHGTELWKSDGTQNGTVLVKDIYPGTTSATVSYLVGFNGRLFFAANNGVNGTELWTSDGTVEGTVLLADIYVGSGSSNPAYLTNVGGVLFFAAYTSSGGTELWRSDGTAEGTMLVKDIYDGNSSYPQSLVNVGGTLFFTAVDAATGRELWQSDGTALGTMLVKDIAPGTANSSCANLTAVGTTLFFAANDGTTGTELWRSDGTAPGTLLVEDICPGSGSSSPTNLTNVSGTLFFAANDGSSGIELWRSSVAPEETAMVTDIRSGSASSSPANLANVGGVLFFSANDGTAGTELWRSDGTAEHTTLVKDIYSGTGSSSPQAMVNFGGTLYFAATTSASGRELWRSDGSEPGTVLVKDIYSGSGGSSPLYPTIVGDTLFFSAYLSGTGRELWRSDGSEAGTILARDVRSGTADSSPAYFTEFNGSVYFAMTTASYGTELWTSDGTLAGTTLVKDVRSGSSSAGVANLTSVGGALFFTANDGTSGTELWRTDGTPGGTSLVKDIFSGSSNSSPSNLTNVGGTLFFIANNGTEGAELWKSDGTAEGTVLVKDIWPGSSGSSITYLTNVGGTLFFRANNGTDGTELWTSDGTPEGTVLVKDIYAGSGSAYPSNLTAVGDTVYFQAYDGSAGYELWRSDGTAPGTVLVKDIYSGGSSSYPAWLTNVNGTLFFSANDGDNGAELWKSGGTDATTVMVRNIYSSTNSSSPAYLTNVGGVLFFAASNGTNGAELWKSDGTSSGTMLVKDIWPGSNGSSIRTITNVAGVAYFVANDGTAGGELWTSDGTAAGTSQADLAFAGDASDPQWLTAFGGTLYFNAADAIAGRELWILPEPLRVISLVATDATPTTAAAVHYTVTFNRAVAAVGAADFIVYAEGMPDAVVTSVVGGGAVYTITVAPGTGQGRLRLLLADDDSVADSDGNPLGGPGPGNGSYASDWYAIDRQGPIGRILDVLPEPRNGAIDHLAILFSEAPAGLDLDDLELTRDGGANLLTAAQTLTGGGATWFLGNLAGLTATSGHYTLRIVAAGSGIVDAWGNAMADDAVRSWTIGDHTPPAAFDDAYDVPSSTLFQVSAPGILANDTCEAGYTLATSLVSGPRHGTLSLAADGSFQYTSDTGYSGTDSFVYRASDGSMDVTATVFLRVGAPQLVGDLNSTLADSSPTSLTAVGSLVFFIATDASHGTELWRTDGTVAGTFLLKDICPGTASGSVTYLTNVNGMLYFRASDGISGAELWRSDGTPEGTVMVKDISPGSSSSSPMYFTNFNGTLFFRASDGTNGTELWQSDGTAEGTKLFADLYSGSGSSSPANLAVAGGNLFFSAYDSAHGTELWRSDGTPEGTALVEDIYPGTGSSYPVNLTDAGGTLFFLANDGTHGNELWASDGTPEGTTLVTDFVAGSDSSALTNLTAASGVLFFRAATSDCGTELWRSDGSEAGTWVLDINPGTGSSLPVQLTNINGTLFFQATDGSTGYELWTSDGTVAGTTLVKDIRLGSVGSYPAYMASLDGTLYFEASDGSTGYELWASDGTADGTVLVKDIWPGTTSSSPVYLVGAAGILYFVGSDPVYGRELFRSDGSEEGTGLLCDVRTGNRDATPQFLVEVGGTLYFRATSATSGTELWKREGTSAPTMVADLYAGINSSYPAYLTYACGTLFFEATTSATGYELWKTDGTAGGTTLVKDMCPGTGSSSPVYLVRVGDLLFFRASDGSNGTELWRSDGTADGTFMVKDIYPGSGNSNPSYLTNLNGVLFFQASNGTNGTELWRSDGTADGTFMVKDIYSGSGNSSPANLVECGGLLYFGAYASGFGTELWRSDGTADGTFMVKDINAGSGYSYPANFATANGMLFFAANDGTGGAELWASDGTADGTVRVLDIWPGANGSAPANLTAVGGTLFFAANDGTHGTELWKTDGTPEGTVLVKDIAAGPDDAYIQNLADVGGSLYFKANDGVHGGELWRSDGTEAGTVITSDIGPDAESSDPAELTACGDALYFTAVDGTGGRELWVLTVGGAPVAAADAYAIGEDHALIVSPAQGVLVNDSDPESDPLQAVLVAGPAHGTLLLNSDGSFTYTAAPDYYGTDSFTYKAFDGGAFSAETLVSITVNSENDPPVIAELTGSPDPVIVGDDLLLTATGVGDPHDPAGAVVSVAFYRESNGTPGLQVPGDTLVGSDASAAGGWSATVSTAGLAPDVYVYYAQATDNEGGGSVAVLTSITVQGTPRQIVSDTPTMIAAAPGQMLTIPVLYTVSSGDATLTGLGLRLHYNSSLLTYNGLTGVLPTPIQQQPPEDDLGNWDNDPQTDKYVFISWADVGGNWPNAPLPTQLFVAGFTLAPDAPADIVIPVRFSASATAAGYGFESQPVTVRVLQANLDADGNGIADALTDGILILRYLFDPNGGWSVIDALGGGATRTSREQIRDFLDGGRTTALDADGNGVADPLSDGILILRYLFDSTGAWNVDDALGSGATRTTREAIKAHLFQYIPGFSAEIHGTKFNDLNGNGGQDAGEPVLAGWTIYLDANNNGQLDAGERSTVTGADGRYALTGLPAGIYTVREELQAGWEQTSPASQVISDNFEDSSIDSGLWVVGGQTRTYYGGTGGDWSISQTEMSGSLQLHVSGPDSGLTYGADVWARTVEDYNDGQFHTINFVWEPEYVDAHHNDYLIQVTDGNTFPEENLHWNGTVHPGTTNLLWMTDHAGQQAVGWYLGEDASIDPPGPVVPPGPGQLTWSVTIDPTGLARLYEGPDATGALRSSMPLDSTYPWYLRFMLVDGTSMGFPAGDSQLNLYSFSSHTAAGQYGVKLAAGQVATGKDFGNWQLGAPSMVPAACSPSEDLLLQSELAPTNWANRAVSITAEAYFDSETVSGAEFDRLRTVISKAVAVGNAATATFPDAGQKTLPRKASQPNDLRAVDMTLESWDQLTGCDISEARITIPPVVADVVENLTNEAIWTDGDLEWFLNKPDNFSA